MSELSGETHTIRLKTKLQERNHGFVIWLFGLSGSGKTTLARGMQARLVENGQFTVVLDGDDVRAGLNRDLGFEVEDRTENIRRVAEVARLLTNSGTIVICACITPLQAHRTLVREIVGADKLLPVFLDVPIGECIRRDPKGLYRLAASSDLKNFTGLNSPFEHPVNDEKVFVLDTLTQPVALSLKVLKDEIDRCLIAESE